MPVEILSLIFVFVNEAIFDLEFRQYPGCLVREPPSQQPSHSPPLLVGAVCKDWRDVSLTTRRLWTDIIVHLDKDAEGQREMVDKWAHRSGTLPLDITIILDDARSEHQGAVFAKCRDVFSGLRSFASRWNDIALYTPPIFWIELVTNLDQSPQINGLFLPYMDQCLGPLQLQHHLRPRQVISAAMCGKELPFIEYNRLVLLEVEGDYAYAGDVLHVVRHAQNLRYCTGGSSNDSFSPHFPIPTSPITNHSLIYLDTFGVLIEHLNLPSLRHFEYRVSRDVERCFNSLVSFIDRSCAPLDKFTIQLQVFDNIPIAHFQRLPGITALVLVQESYGQHHEPAWLEHFLLALTEPSMEKILPHLEKMSIKLPSISASSWLLISGLFPKDPTANMESDFSNNPIVPNRPLSSVEILLTANDKVEMDRDTFLRLLEVKKSGVDLRLEDYAKRDVLDYIAQVNSK